MSSPRDELDLAELELLVDFHKSKKTPEELECERKRERAEFAAYGKRWWTSRTQAMKGRVLC